MSLKHKNLEVLHIVEHEKFITPFIELVNKNLNPEKHHFYFIHNGHKYQDHVFNNLTLNAEPKNIIRFIWDLRQATQKPKKIILHGLFSSRLILTLTLQPQLLKKCYWVIWGGDLYTYLLDKKNIKWKTKEFFRKIIIPKIGHLITYIPGDIELARQ
ncbi:MAG: TDP-N-acetylfucosamine:lipid II N-acetylfucosaminyltransferase, partial [Methylomonas sp.]